MLDFSTLMFRAPALLIALTIHEYAHACVSDSLGDPTPGLQGRLTLNPLANLCLCFVAVLIMTARGSLGMSSNMVNQFLYWLMLYNVWFAFFNLIPIPPLDGSKILETFMDYETAYKFERFVGQYGFIVLVLIVYSGISNMIIGPLASWYLKICYGIASILF